MFTEHPTNIQWMPSTFHLLAKRQSRLLAADRLTRFHNEKLSLLLFNKKFNFNQMLLGSDVLNQNDSKAIHTVTHLSDGEFNMFDGQLNELQVAIVIRVSCFLAEFRIETFD